MCKDKFYIKLIKKFKRYIKLINKNNVLISRIMLDFGILVAGLGVIVFFVVGALPTPKYGRVPGRTDNVYQVVGVKGMIFPFHFPEINLRVKAYYRNGPVIGIGDEAFKKSSIKSISIPATIKFISTSAFENCKKLKSVNTYYPDVKENYIDVYSIGSNAFANCKSLKEIEIDNDIKYIMDDIFYGCDDLVIYYDGSSSQWSSCGGNLDYNLIYTMCEINIYFKYSDPVMKYYYDINEEVDSLPYKLKDTGYQYFGLMNESNELVVDINGNFNEPFMIKHDIDLYVKAEPNTYIVTIYDTNTTYEVIYGEPTDLPILEKTGYYFIGYYTMPNGKGTNISNGIPWYHPYDLTLYPFYMKK